MDNVNFKSVWQCLMLLEGKRLMTIGKCELNDVSCTLKRLFDLVASELPFDCHK